MEIQEGSELLTTLYRLRESAQKVLRGDVEERQKLCLYMGKLAGAVDLQGGTDETIKQAFEEVMPAVLDKMAAYPQDEKDLTAELPQNKEMYALYGMYNCKAFHSAQAFLSKTKDELQKLTDKKVVSKGGKAETEDSQEVLALKEEIRRWIQSTKKIDSDKTRKEALKQLDNAEKLNVTAKSNIITVDFGMADVKAVFALALNGVRFESPSFISRFGGMQEVLGVEETKKFAEKLVKHKKGKDYLTAKGQTIENAAKALQKVDKKKKDNALKQQELQQKIEDDLKKLGELRQKMVREANPVLAWEHLVKERIKKGDTALIEQMAQSVLDSKALWSIYLPSEEEQKYNRQSEYDQLVSWVTSGVKIREIVEDGYKLFERGGDKGTCAQLTFTKVAANSLFKTVPEEIGRQIVLDEAFRFGLNTSDKNTDDKKIEFMNEILAAHHIKIGFASHKITEKCEDTRLNDVIHEKDGTVKTYKKKMTALLYGMGKIIGNSEPASKIRDVLFNSDLKRQFAELQIGTWDIFVRNDDNIARARETKRLIDEEYGQNAEAVVAAMREGREVAGDSLHHVLYAYYAPLLGRDKEKLVEKFNSKENTVEVLHGHPALTDMHKDVEHRFNISSGGRILVERDGQNIYKTANTAQVGDVLKMPVIMVRKDESEKFHPLMTKGQLFMTSNGNTVSDPYDFDGGNGLFKMLDLYKGTSKD